jgi:hypothetical protein
MVDGLIAAIGWLVGRVDLALGEHRAYVRGWKAATKW